jgi:hypothetical protein
VFCFSDQTVLLINVVKSQMRQPQNAKRGRGRGRRGNGNNNYNNVPNRNTSYESNGPDVKLRGNAQQLHEKYMALAHDAATAGERITAEAYTQFADHYFRLHQAAVGVAETRRQQDQSGTGDDAENADAGQNAGQNTGQNAGQNTGQNTAQNTGQNAQPDGGADDEPGVTNGAAEEPAAPAKRPRGDRKSANGKANGADAGAEGSQNLSPAQLAEAVQDDQDGKLAS